MQDQHDIEAHNQEGPQNRAVQVPQTGAVSIRLPQFWANTELWFAEVEIVFSNVKIFLQKAQFNHVIANLPVDIVNEIRDLLITLPQDARMAYSIRKS